ncbi:MAG: hypothetical protein A2087_04800 [Spirochaetes bacterium GWD1_61_31]|nr:MAG: hypothetical protein A2Y37_01660 [Spirochaetes bacterium GWB1_60_80]OHD34920.1 MAG: hypothetical protein A2004_00690 [Spirochaetes bacterium GWC1_61_12]OHD37051.1 MAG: hypothetical protein A2087_04800 [Spirochaetes bacterium GWD1_61_31]OHD45339.1 MAG: hypothetical protein A2Y35_00590 [Spirochaetes bacterium GWE1_60_18]OHD61091.1 MAG: hypothetical protein A2Y32_09275 [Spirochaetes bacterium GWF1_60_12]HAP42753.1 hypothetical protein [Spirochaetaceae bacterium]
MNDRLLKEKTLILDQLLRFLVIVGGIAYVPSMIAAVSGGLYLIAVVDSAVYLAIAGLAFWPRLPDGLRISALVFFSFAVGAVVLFLTGPNGAGYIWFSCAIVLSALFMRRRLVVLQLALAVATLAVYAYCIDRGWLNHGYAVLSVVIISSNLLLVSLILVFLIHRLLASMRQSYQEQTVLAECLASELADSRRFQAELSTVLEHKDELLRELNHRVKNNLQLVSSLLGLDGDVSCGDSTAGRPAGQVSLATVQRRLQVLATVNELFLETTASGRIDLTRLFESLVICRLDSVSGRAQRCVVRSLDSRLGCTPQAATVLALLVDEVLENLGELAQDAWLDVCRTAGRWYLLVGPGGSGLDSDGATRLVERLLGNLAGDRFFGTPAVEVDWSSLPGNSDSVDQPTPAGGPNLYQLRLAIDQFVSLEPAPPPGG